ncbi:TonB-dependent receptor [Portibacter marinus]|uniref:TonB-dependent receptor n=1 Tax=Portibacter marinus TaxID=2898660 RepID=UPI001F242CEC|nr:TonB-dependent receptor [Portibacter marinus]
MKLTLHKLVIVIGLSCLVLNFNQAKSLFPDQQEILLTEALELLSEKYQIFFAYDADLLRGLKVDDQFLNGQSLEETVNNLLEETGLLYDKIDDKYCVIYKDDRKGKRDKKKLERKIREIEAIKSKGNISIQKSKVRGTSKMPVEGVLKGIREIETRTERRRRKENTNIKGIITDESSGETLIGANVALMGSSLGAVTDLNGEYIIYNVPTGTYNLQYSYLGYKTVVKENVEISGSEPIVIDVALAPESIMGEEVVITAQVKGQRAAINQQISSNSITNIVSSDKIQDVPDVNAAESIGRLPGVSLQRSGGEGNKVVVRGLSPQFTIVEIDGVRMAGVDGDRSVGLSVISSDMLDGIELTKSLTPDKDSDAIGGVVNLRLRGAEEGLHYRVMALGGYNSLENSFRNYRLGGSIGNRFFNNKVGVLFTIGQEQVIRSADRFNATYEKNIGENEELYTTSATITEQKNVRQRSNGSLMLDFKNDFMSIKFNNFISQMINENEFRYNRFRFNSNDFRFDIADNRPIERIRSHSLRSEFDILSSVLSLDLSYSNTTLNDKRDQYNFIDDTVLGGSSISENKKLFAQPSSLIDEFFDISSSEKSLLLDNVRSTSIRDDITQTANLSWKLPFTFGDNISGNIKIGGKYVQKERSNDTESLQTYYWGGIGIGRVNTYVNPNYPDFLTREDVGITSAEGLVGFNFDDPDYDYGEILNGRYQLGWSADLEKLKSVHDKLYEQYGKSLQWTQGVQSNQNDFQNLEIMKAAFIMAEINFGKKVMILPGVRVEEMNTTYTGSYLLEDNFDPDGLKWVKEVTAERQNLNWFPSINMRVELNDWSDLRAAAYRSSSRPDYNLLSPSMIANFDLTRLTSYNPFLKPSLANNFDLGVSFYANKLGLFTVNLFYKEISGLIYRLPRYQPEYFDILEGAPASLIESLQAPRVLYDDDLFKKSGTLNNNVPINNPNNAYFRGFEVSWQTNFWYLPGFWKGLVLDLNYSLIASTTRFPYLEIVTTWDDSGIIPIPVETPVYNTRESRMLDQPVSLFNARIGYDYKGLSTRLSFRYQGETINGIDPVHSLLDRRTGDVFRIDLTARQQITKALSFSLDLANLNQFVDDSFIIAQGRVLPSSSEYYGLTAQAGFRYEF